MVTFTLTFKGFSQNECYWFPGSLEINILGWWFSGNVRYLKAIERESAFGENSSEPALIADVDMRPIISCLYKPTSNAAHILVNIDLSPRQQQTKFLVTKHLKLM